MLLAFQIQNPSKGGRVLDLQRARTPIHALIRRAPNKTTASVRRVPNDAVDNAWVAAERRSDP
jgi:hypothetical protein